MNKQPLSAGKDGATSASPTKHAITLIGRKRLEISGVKDVLRFDESVAELSTALGDLAVDGRELRIEIFDTERGIVLLTGEIDAMTYLPTDVTSAQKKGGFFSKRR